jgi:O-phospho-L-seryl-tRNASec:L-selenocysteinyl-tRNA synthase
MESTLRNLYPQIPPSSLNQGISNLVSQNKTFTSLLQHKRLPEYGWDDQTIQSFLILLRQLDTNNSRPVSMQCPDPTFPHRWCGVGEREGRVYSNMVANRHYGFSHGVGRSGDLTEVQPKAVGSSILVQLTTRLALDAMQRGAGLSLESTRFGLLLPLCTGMSMALVLASFTCSTDRRKNVVLWSRIDQKSCLKAIYTAGFECVVVPTRVHKDEVVCDVDALANLIQEYEARIVAVITTTSCFAPRIPDPVEHIAKLCLKANIPHIINNAYGLQCRNICKMIHRATVLGRVDAIICSMDKNFLVPVGGAIVTSPKKAVIDVIAKIFAGRASSSAILDLFITLLSMGLNGYKQLLDTRNNLLSQFTLKFQEIAAKYGARLLSCPNNTISFAITLDHLILNFPISNSQPILDDRPVDMTDGTETKNCSETNSPFDQSSMMPNGKSNVVSYFGSMLFTRCVSGTRAVPVGETKVICGHQFRGYGSSTDEYPSSYLTAACAIGLTRSEMDEFFVRLEKCFDDYFRRKL